MHFQLFRQCFLIAVILISIASMAICLKMLPPLHLMKTLYLSTAVQTAYIIRSFYSIARKPLWKSSQGVGTELIGLFILLPFEAVLALVISTGALEERGTDQLPVVVLALVLVVTLLNFSYTVCLLVASVLTAVFFDFDIWLRDIDSSPCPFPGPVLFAWLHDKWDNRGRGSQDEDKTASSMKHYCLPGCNCQTKLAESDDDLETMGIPSRRQTPRPNPSEEYLLRDTSRPQSLIRIPNAAEQRHVIPVAFEVA